MGVLCTRVFFVRAAVALLAARPSLRVVIRSVSVYRVHVTSTGAVYRTTYQSCRRRVFIARARTGCAAPRCHNRANAPSSIYTVRRKLVGCAPGWAGGGLTCTLVNQPYLPDPT